ncbi:hypothetical protein C0Q70_15184 [Pomacea canaliculata]|uniref:PrdX deacylase domain-containing protein 1 n=1 Tax=Pomacea canaliculata TaxID=400727 RepID=A0A2T7NU44_POMCA|nr:hypothetical protein C0Q70_15184 [Pomacea canaliculata]
MKHDHVCFQVYTVEEALPHTNGLPGVFAKNLFLKDKKKSLWLFCAPHDLDVKLNDLAKLVGVPGGFRFADEAALHTVLGVRQGAVTLFGLVNDVSHQVKLILDESFWEEGKTDGSIKETTKTENKLEKDCDPITETLDKMQVTTEGKGSSPGLIIQDEEHASQHRIYFHPLVNSASTGITLLELKQFLAYTGHEPIVVKCLSKKI